MSEISAQNSDSGWQWYAGSNDEWFEVGPCDSREDALSEAVGNCLGEFKDSDGVWKLGIHVVEARRDPLNLADWMDFESAVERAEERLIDSDRVSYDFEDGPFFTHSIEQQKDLEERLKKVCRDWQKEHGLIFKTRTFSNARNNEYVVVEHPSLECVIS